MTAPSAIPRSPRAKLAGLYHLGRMIDKIRLHQAGQLPADYHPNLGLTIGLDGQLCGFLGIDFSALCEQVATGASDEALAGWCFANGLRPNRTQVRIWNEFSRKFGWNDRVSGYVQKVKAEEGLEHRAEIVTAFDAIDAMEGRSFDAKTSPGE